MKMFLGFVIASADGYIRRFLRRSNLNALEGRNCFGIVAEDGGYTASATIPGNDIKRGGER